MTSPDAGLAARMSCEAFVGQWTCDRWARWTIHGGNLRPIHYCTQHARLRLLKDDPTPTPLGHTQPWKKP